MASTSAAEHPTPDTGPAPGRPARCARTGWRGVRGDRGSVSAELVITTPVLLLMLLGIVQFALWSHATHIAQAAAARGLATARAQDTSTTQGAAAAQQVLDDLGRGPLRRTQIRIDRDATTATVEIRGEATTLIPLLRLPVHAETTGPRERFSPGPPPGS